MPASADSSRQDIAVARVAGVGAAGMSKVAFGTEYDDAINSHAQAGATAMRRGAANIEDQFRSALALLDGLGVIDKAAEKRLKEAINAQMSTFLGSLLQMETEITAGSDPTSKLEARGFLQSFLLCFASRAASRERLHVFTRLWRTHCRPIGSGAPLERRPKAMARFAFERC